MQTRPLPHSKHTVEGHLLPLFESAHHLIAVDCWKPRTHTHNLDQLLVKEQTSAGHSLRAVSILPPDLSNSTNPPLATTMTRRTRLNFLQTQMPIWIFLHGHLEEIRWGHRTFLSLGSGAASQETGVCRLRGPRIRASTVTA